MTQTVDVTVTDQTGSRTEEASLPVAAPAGRVIQRLVEMMDLPTTGPDGTPLVYSFTVKRTARPIGDNETLQDAGVTKGDILRLTTAISAG
jgi:uncharacterized ubiquitin-like protein YukD